MALTVTASDAQGALSEGDNSNTAFGGVARVGDICYVDIAPPEGYYHPNYTVSGIPHAQISLSSSSGFGGEGEDFSIGEFASERRIYIMVASPASPAPKLKLSGSGFIATSDGAAGGAGSIAGIVATASATATAGGGAGVDGGAIGSTWQEVLVGDAYGSSGSTAGSEASAAASVVVDGVAASTSGAYGSAAAVTASTSVSGTFYPHTNGTLNTTANTVDTVIVSAPAGDGYSVGQNALEFRWGTGAWSTLLAGGLVATAAAEAAYTLNLPSIPEGTASFSLRVGATIATFTLPAGQVLDTTKTSRTLRLYWEHGADGYYDEDLEEFVTTGHTDSAYVKYAGWLSPDGYLKVL